MFLFLIVLLLLTGGPAWSEEVESGKPQVRIVVPGPEQYVSGTLSIHIEVSASEEIGQVVVSRDGAFLESDTAAPYEIRWNTQREADGPHTLLARAQTSLGSWGTSSGVSVMVDNTRPTVQLTKPLPQAAVPGKIELAAAASDNIGVAEVRFLLGPLMLGAVKSPPFTLVWDPSTTPNGKKVLKAMAVDRAGNSSLSKEVEIKVANINHPPTLPPLDSMTIAEGRQLSFVVNAYDLDGPRDPITYRAYGLPGWATLNAKTGEFKGTPDGAVASRSTPQVDIPVRFEACDPEPLCEDQQITISVTNVNRPPSLPRPANLTVHEGEPVDRILEPATDPDVDSLKYAMKRLPAWLTFDADTRRLHGTADFKIASLSEPEVAYPPAYLEACDPEPSCAKDLLTIKVLDTDRPPVLEPTPEKRLEEGKSVSFDIRATDLDQDPITLTAQPLPQGATFQDHADGTGTFRWDSRVDQGGGYQVTFKASDGTLSDEEKVQIIAQEITLCISGIIASAEGIPQAEVTVALEKAGKAQRQAETDGQGFYLFEGLAPGLYILRPSRQTPASFSSRARGPEGVHFDPLSQAVTLENSDKQAVNFTALPLE